MGLLTQRSQLNKQEIITQQNERIIKLLEQVNNNLKCLYEEFLRETIRNQRRNDK